MRRRGNAICSRGLTDALLFCAAFVPLGGQAAYAADLTVATGTTTTLTGDAVYDNLVNNGTIRLNGQFGLTVNGTYSGTGNFTVGGTGAAYAGVLSDGIIFKSNVALPEAMSIFQQTWFNIVADGSTVTFKGSLDVGNGTSNPNNRYAFSMVNGGRFVLGASARINNNLPDSINARSVFVYADANANNVFEFDPDFDADISKDFALADGVSVLRLGGGSATFISHASKNLPTIRKLANTTPVTNTHHGVLSFAHRPGDVARWIVRTNDQSYDGQLSFSNPTTIVTEKNLTVDGVYHPGANVGWLSGTQVIKDGVGDLILSGDQAHRPLSSILVREGTLRLRSDPGTPVPWDGATGQNMSLWLRGTGRAAIETPLVRVTSVRMEESCVVDVGSSRTLESSGSIRLDGGRLVGTGTVRGQIEFGGGTISPADGGTVGTLVLDGTVYASSGRYRFDLEGSSVCDRVDISGAASFGGLTVEVSRARTFVPVPGEAWTVATFASRTGDVAIANFTGLAGLRFTAEWSTTSLSLRASARPGDANVDNQVDFSDLLMLASNYNAGLGRTWLSGDFNQTGTVDFDDLLILAANYNQPAPSAGAWALAGTVPEPASLAAAFVAALLLPRSRKRRCM